jgi:hypothetical protein
VKSRTGSAWPPLLLAVYYLAIGWAVYHPPPLVLYLTGASREAGPIYGFWSGFGGSLLFSAAVLFPLWYYQHTCHDSFSCLRWGRYPAAGGIFKLCHRHHPDFAGQRPHRDLIRTLHRKYQ